MHRIWMIFNPQRTLSTNRFNWLGAGGAMTTSQMSPLPPGSR